MMNTDGHFARYAAGTVRIPRRFTGPGERRDPSGIDFDCYNVDRRTVFSHRRLSGRPNNFFLF
jgi:hypothetical protein